MFVNNVGKTIYKWISHITNLIGYIGSYFIVILMLMMVADVIARHMFNNPITGIYEISVVILVIVVFFTLGACQLKKSNISIDLLISRFSKTTQNIIDTIIFFMCLCFTSVLTWRFILYAIKEYQSGSLVSTTLGLPVYPFIIIAATGCLLLSVIFLLHFTQSLLGGFGK
jgi:TRAP-type transport system small permease protein